MKDACKMYATAALCLKQFLFISDQLPFSKIVLSTRDLKKSCFERGGRGKVNQKKDCYWTCGVMARQALLFVNDMLHRI